MAKRVKATDGKEATGVSALRGNGFDPEKVQDFVKRIESCQADIDEIMQDAKNDCAPHREDIDAIKDEAHNAGLPRRALNAVISKRRAERRAEEIREKLNEEQQSDFDKLLLALGDLAETDLGKAALEKAAPGEVHAH